MNEVNGTSTIDEVMSAYYTAENERRSKWIDETLRALIPEALYLRWQGTGDKQALEEMMRAWLKEEGYRMEVSPDNILIQVWKGNEQVAQYQTIVPKVVEFVDGEQEKVENN